MPAVIAPYGTSRPVRLEAGEEIERGLASPRVDAPAVPPMDWHYRGAFAFGRRGGSAGAWKHSGNIEGISSRWKMDVPSRGFGANNGFRCVRTAPSQSSK